MNCDADRDISSHGGLVISTPVLIATIFVVCTAFSSQMLTPLWIGAIIDDYQFTEKTAGRIASIEFITVAIISLLMAARIHRFNIRSLCVLGLVCLLFGNGGAVLVTDISQLTICRTFAGIGKGLMVAGIFSLFARTANPTRSFAVLNGSYTAFSAGFYMIVPIFIERNGASGALMTMFIITILGSMLVYWVPIGRTTSTATNTPSRSGSVGLAGILVLSALVIMWAGHSAIWTFIERIGVRAGMDITRIGAVLSVSALLTILGPTLAHILHTRYGFRKPLIFALSLKVVVAAVLCNVVNTTAFITATPFLNLIALFIVPYLMGLMSIADPKGRLAAAAAAAMTAGGSLGSYIGGITLTESGYGVLSIIVISLFVLVMVLIHLTIKQVPGMKLEPAV